MKKSTKFHLTNLDPNPLNKKRPGIKSEGFFLRFILGKWNRLVPKPKFVSGILSRGGDEPFRASEIPLLNPPRELNGEIPNQQGGKVDRCPVALLKYR